MFEWASSNPMAKECPRCGAAPGQTCDLTKGAIYSEDDSDTPPSHYARLTARDPGEVRGEQC